MTAEEPPTIPEYRLHLDVDFPGRAWSGRIDFDLPAAAPRLALDAEGLEIRAVRAGSEALPFRLEGDGRLTIELDGARGAALSIEFAGRVVERSLMGLYACPQGDDYLLTTQCEPIGARRIFPCIDRPDRKARFQLEVVTEAAQEVVSNAPATAVHGHDGRRQWTFAPTPSMAPYLFYLAIGKFESVEERSGRVPVRVLAPPGRGASGRFGAENGARILAAYEAYYGIPYPLPKLDLVAVSEQAFGAMENWGAICFRDMRLLIDAESPSFARRDVFETIAHEIAHQWFGNLVTMRWWDDVWLNESFAMLLESKITEALRPEFEPIHEFLLRPWGMGAARAGDSLRATHPVRGRVDRPEEISQIFDAISYGKGSSVLRMLEGFLGSDRFRAGVTDYLSRFRFANARTEDLWGALERAAGRPVAPLIGPWIDRPGLPVVSAHLGPAGLELAQARFSFHGAIEEAPWPIPLQLDLDGRRKTVLFEGRTTTLPLEGATTVHLNPGALGFYRARYDAELLDRLLRVLPDRPAIDRWIVLDDLAAFVMSGDVDWATYARAVGALGRTSDRLVVEELLDQLTDWALALPDVARVQDLARGFLADQFDRVGFARRAGEEESLGILREAVVFARVRVDLGFARALAEQFAEWNRLDPDVRAAVAIGRARADGEAGYHEIVRALDRADTETERLRFERALAWAGEPALVARTLERIRTGGVGAGHVVSVLANVAANPVGRPLLGPWLEEHLPRLAEEFRGSSDLTMLLERTVPLLGLARPDATREHFRTHPYPEGARGLAKGLESLEILERLRARLTGA